MVERDGKLGAGDGVGSIYGVLLRGKRIERGDTRRQVGGDSCLHRAVRRAVIAFC